MFDECASESFGGFYLRTQRHGEDSRRDCLRVCSSYSSVNIISRLKGKEHKNLSSACCVVSPLLSFSLREDEVREEKCHYASSIHTSPGDF
jgi:hypothetical protein